MQEKLIFYYSAMKGGKTSRIFSKIHDLEEIGQKVLLIKPENDTKGEDKIVNRLNQTRKVDILLPTTSKIVTEETINQIYECNHIIVDEAQFLTSEQIEELWTINKTTNIPITCFGLLTNFRGELFPGSKRLIEMADEKLELGTNSLCTCGATAKFNARQVNGKFTMEGEEIEIDGASSNVEYIPLCGTCYYNKVYRKGKK